MGSNTGRSLELTMVVCVHFSHGWESKPGISQHFSRAPPRDKKPWTGLRPVFNFDPRGELRPPGIKLAPWGEDPLFIPPFF
jgi:hypothetical protein